MRHIHPGTTQQNSVGQKQYPNYFPAHMLAMIKDHRVWHHQVHFVLKTVYAVYCSECYQLNSRSYCYTGMKRTDMACHFWIWIRYLTKYKKWNLLKQNFHGNIIVYISNKIMYLNMEFFILGTLLLDSCHCSLSGGFYCVIPTDRK
jgi:hypothetical protein